MTPEIKTRITEIQNSQVPNGYKKTKVGIVPNDWEEFFISDVLEKTGKAVKVESETLYEQIGIRSHGKGIFYKDFVTGKKLGNKKVFWIEPNCLIFNVVFAWEQAVAVTTQKEKGKIGSHRFPMYLEKNGKVSNDYLFKFFMTKRGKTMLEEASPGGAGRNKTLGQDRFEKSKIHLPPLAEQEKIAEILSTQDKLIELKEKLIAEKELQKKYLMQQLLKESGELGVESGELGVESGKWKVGSGDFNLKAEKWKKVKLGDLGETFSGLNGKKKDDFGRGKAYIPYLNIFKNSIIDLANLEYVEVATGENQNKVKYGDIFFTTSSETPQEVGMSSVLLSEIEELYLNSFCFGFRLHNHNTLNPRFAAYYFRGKYFRDILNMLAQGATRFNLSKNSLMNCIIALPPLPIQEKIANILSKADREIELLKKDLEEEKNKKKALMQMLLTGIIRVES